MVAQGSPIRQFTLCCSSNSPASGREGEVYAKNEDFEICNQTMSNWSFIGVCVCISVHRTDLVLSLRYRTQQHPYKAVLLSTSVNVYFKVKSSQTK